MNRPHTTLVLLAGATLPENLSRFDRILCADSGYLAIAEAGITPTRIIGDMDSLPQEALQQARDAGIELIIHPVEKDAADGELAVRDAIAAGAGEILICGGRLGRLDHILSSPALLYTIPGDIKAELRIDNDCIRLLREGESIRLSNKRPIVSLLPATRECVITGTGLKWSLDRQLIVSGSTLGIHNEIIEPEVTLQADQGDVYVVTLSR
jgi:thiamine pyrophosphokinase